MVNAIAVGLVLFGSFIGAFGTLMVKKSVDKYSFFHSLKSRLMWAGIIFYGASTLFYIVALRKEELSIIYPLVSTTYVWTTLFSVRYLKEEMNQWKWLGLGGIILGVILIGFGS
jgi:drug/metabolite transporter (DMT)-like permease